MIKRFCDRCGKAATIELEIDSADLCKTCYDDLNKLIDDFLSKKVDEPTNATS